MREVSGVVNVDEEFEEALGSSYGRPFALLAHLKDKHGPTTHVSAGLFVKALAALEERLGHVEDSVERIAEDADGSG